MKTPHLTFLLALGLLGSSAVGADGPAKLPTWKSLFNGKDLDGWGDTT